MTPDEIRLMIREELTAMGYKPKQSRKPRIARITWNCRSFLGITDDDILELYPILLEHEVTIVEGPTGSGKSTFLPYRLMVPPPGKGYAPDLFTRFGQIIVTQPRIQATRGIPVTATASRRRTRHESTG